jgi:hypothetical protein
VIVPLGGGKGLTYEKTLAKSFLVHVLFVKIATVKNKSRKVNEKAIGHTS